MKKIILLFSIIFLFSCTENKKKYKFIEIVDEENISGKIERKEIVEIREYDNDSLASIMAYSFYCLHLKLDKDYFDRNIKDYSKTIDFKLLNENNTPIFTDKYLTEEAKKKIYEEMFKKNNILEPTYTDKEPSKEEIEIQFSSIDGHHIKLEEYVISRMNNPDSYKHVSSQYKIMKGYLDVILTFRGTNSYNAIITNKVQAKCDLLTGEIIQIVNEE